MDAFQTEKLWKEVESYRLALWWCDDVMADKGFTIGDLLPLCRLSEYSSICWALWSDATRGCSKNPSYCCVTGIHVDGDINKIKNFHIWDRVTPLSLFSYIKPNVNSLWFFMQCPKSHFITTMYYILISFQNDAHETWGSLSSFIEGGRGRVYAGEER